MRHVLRLMAIACFGLAALGTANAEKHVALVIGNSAYQHTSVLPNPKNDAEAIARMLRQIGFAEADVALKTDLGYQALREELRVFAGRTAGADVAIVYYAGHGIEVGGENYLVPVDAKLASDRDLDWEAVSLASVLNVLGDARKLKLVILDACRTNPLSDKMVLRAGVTRDVSRGLVRIEPKGDLLVAYAAKAGTVALDGKGRHSPYAEALLNHMATPGLDVFRMFGRVAEAVQEATDKRQEPWLYGRPGGETFALVPADGAAEKPFAGRWRVRFVGCGIPDQETCDHHPTFANEGDWQMDIRRRRHFEFGRCGYRGQSHLFRVEAESNWHPQE
jgi:uncharacterized caspase-like protein